MKNLLSIKEILITIAISYILMSYINSTLNPFELSIHDRIIQIFIIALSLYIQAMIKKFNK
jgi:hypothetical protein